MAVTNQYMESAVNTMYELSTDERVQEQCRRRAEYEYFQKLQEEKILALHKMVADRDAEIADKEAEIADKEAEIANKDAEIADKEAEIAELKRLLAENSNKIHSNQK